MGIVGHRARAAGLAFAWVATACTAPTEAAPTTPLDLCVADIVSRYPADADVTIKASDLPSDRDAGYSFFVAALFTTYSQTLWAAPSPSHVMPSVLDLEAARVAPRIDALFDSLGPVTGDHAIQYISLYTAGYSAEGYPIADTALCAAPVADEDDGAVLLVINGEATGWAGDAVYPNYATNAVNDGTSHD